VFWKVTGEVGEAVAVADGSQIAFVGGSGEEIWLMKTGGEDRRRILGGDDGDRLANLAWVSEGRALVFSQVRIGLYRFEVALEYLDLVSGQVATVLSDARLRGSCVSSDGRLVYALAEAAPRQSDVNFWESQMDMLTGQVLSKPRRITNWMGSSLYALSVTRDGKRLAFLKGPYQANVYVGELGDEGATLKNPRRLTLDERDHLPTAWTLDSSAVLFHSDRNGKWEIFTQGLNDRTAELVITAPEDCRAARVSGDGQILYFVRNRDRLWKWTEPLTLMRAHLGGGSPGVVLSERRLYSVRCAQPPASLSILGERKLSHFVFYALDPLRGKGREIARTAVDLPLDQNHWDVSPDGSQIAVLASGGLPGRIRILSLSDRSSRDVTVNGWGGFQSMDWSANGQGWYVSSQSATHANLLYIDLDGHARVLRQQPGRFQTWGVPSPDGHHLAFLEWTSASNVWMVENF